MDGTSSKEGDNCSDNSCSCFGTDNCLRVDLEPKEEKRGEEGQEAEVEEEEVRGGE